MARGLTHQYCCWSLKERFFVFLAPFFNFVAFCFILLFSGMSRNISRPTKDVVLEEFIDIYRSEPCLWQVKNKFYHDRNKREAAYTKLVAKLKEIEPEASKETVQKKINNLRSAVRKEKKKIDSSKKSGTSPDEIYKPTLWYYDLFSFLGDQDIPASSTSNLDDEENASNEVSLNLNKIKSTYNYFIVFFLNNLN